MAAIYSERNDYRVTVDNLRALARLGGSMPQIRVNVTMDPRMAPKMRFLLAVGFPIIDGYEWLYWYWAPEPGVDFPDCGYSGVRLKPKTEASV